MYLSEDLGAGPPRVEAVPGDGLEGRQRVTVRSMCWPSTSVSSFSTVGGAVVVLVFYTDIHDAGASKSIWKFLSQREQHINKILMSFALTVLAQQRHATNLRYLQCSAICVKRLVSRIHKGSCTLVRKKANNQIEKLERQQAN